MTKQLPEPGRMSATPQWVCIHGSTTGTGVPRITLIIPFLDPRGHPENIACWTRHQTLAAEVFEVLVVTDGAQDEATLAELRGVLRPGDRMLRAEGQNSFGLYAAGAAAARGDVLFVTEDHSLPDVDCLSEALRHLDSTGEDAATVRWGHVNHTRVAYMEELVNRRDTAQWQLPGHWNKVRVRGFAVRKEAYLDAGGFDWRYAGFSEAVLAARLHYRGHRVGYVKESGIRHINTENFKELWRNVWGYSWAECAYCAVEDEAFCERYFSASTVLLRHTQITPRVARSLAGSLLKVLWRDRGIRRREGPCSRLGALSVATQLMAQGLLRPLAPLLARVAIWLAQLRFYLWWWNEPRQLQAYSDYWARVSHLARVTYVAQKGVSARDIPVLDPGDPGSILKNGGLGCHGLEEYEGSIFRWTTPVALLHLGYASGDGWVMIDTGGLRGSARHFPLGLFWNGRFIPRGKVAMQDGVLTFRIKQAWCREGAVQELVIAAAPALRNGGEQRWLGLPLCGLTVTATQPVRHARVRAEMQPTQAANPGAGRVLLVNTADQGGGAEAVAMGLLKGLAAHGYAARMVVAAKRTTERTVQVLHALDPRQSLAGTVGRRIRRIAGLEEFDFPATRALLDETARGADIIHCHNLHGDYFDLRLLRTLSLQVPVCLTLHDSWLFTGHCAVPGDCMRWEKGCGRCPDLARPPAIARDASGWNWQRKAAALAGARLYVSAPSQWMLNRARNSLLAPAMVNDRMIPNGLCLETFKPGDRPSARASLGVPPDVFLLTFAAFTGAANPNKDFATIREAVARLGRKKLGRPVWLVVLGGAAPEEVFEGALIRHLPMQSPERVAMWMQASDTHLHAAFEETFGLVVAEAMACGTPVIATSVAGVPEVMRDQAHGFLTPDGDATAIVDAAAKLHDDPALRTQMGARAASHARAHFGIETMLRSHAAWYEDVREAFRAEAASAAR